MSTDAPMPNRRDHTADAVVDRIRRLVDHGEYLLAYDAATAEDTLDLPPRLHATVDYLRVLALARSGATDRALAELESWSDDGLDLPAHLREDRAALRARIAKDRAFEHGVVDPVLARVAAEDYEQISTRLGRPFACINAATLWLLAGEPTRARSLARTARELATASEPDDALDRYWNAATVAEAALVLGDLDMARDAIRRAAMMAPGNLGARASTRRQLALLFAHHGLDADAELAVLANPTVVHYCGHRVSADDGARFAAEIEPRVRREVAAILERHHVGSAYGSLACGADIVVAEELLRAGAALHVVLPFAAEEFVEVSVRSGGEDWVPRFVRCLNAAATVTVTCDSRYLGDDTLFSFASRVAMGDALNRARTLTADALQIAVWDEKPSTAEGGTAHDIGVWRRAGGTTHIITAEPRRTPTLSPSGAATLRRPITAVLFGDIQGFSRLRDEEMLRFLPAVLGTIADAVAPYGESVIARNTWGDAIFLATTDVLSAARCALDIQRALRGLDLRALGLPSDLSLRLAAHVGPVLRLADPLRGVDWVFGRELTRAARIEPRTPPGQVYVTAAFAALLALEPDADVVPEYVGTVTTAKGFETIPMFVLRRGAPRPRV